MLVGVVFMSVTSVLICGMILPRFVLESSSHSVSLFLEQRFVRWQASIILLIIIIIMIIIMIIIIIMISDMQYSTVCFNQT